MILLFSFFRISKCFSSPILATSDSGFTVVHLKYKKPVTIPLMDRMAVILEGQANTFGFSIKFSKTDQEPEVYESFPSESVTITGYELTLFSKVKSEEKVSVPLWLIPKTLCNGTNGLISAEHHLLLNSKSMKFPGNVCLFSQTEFHSATVEAQLNTKDPKSSISIYESLANEFYEDEPLKKCTNNKKCHTHHFGPFFVVIKSRPNKAVRFNLDYEVRVPRSDIVFCHVDSIIKITPGGPKKNAIVFEGSNVKCESRANDLLVIFKYIAIAVAALLVVTIVLQCSGAVDIGEILCPDEEKRRFNNLKKDPYASRIDEPNRDAVDNDQV